MRYFLDENRGSWLRLREGEPYILAEGFHHRDSTWHQTDNLFKEKMLGKDYDYLEKTPAEFAAFAGDRVIDDTSYGRPSPDEVARLTALENKISGIWASVPVPPGAAGITAESFDTPGVD